MEISKKKLFATLFAIGLVAVLVTGATYTWLSDTETVAWELEVKTADLEVEPEDLTFPKAAPGESTYVDITVKNVGEVRMTVSLSGSCDQGEWVTFAFSNNDFELAPDGETTVQVTITVSDEYTISEGTLTGKITVSGVQTH